MSGHTNPDSTVSMGDFLQLNTRYEATKFVLDERERELLELKGPCSSAEHGCPLHYAHSGPCDIPKKEKSSANAD